jgi:hypothetical protein
VMRWLVWTEGSQDAVHPDNGRMTQRLFRSCHSITEPQYRITRAKHPHRWHRTIQWIHGSLNSTNCSFCLTQSHTIVITLPWWGSSVSRYSVGFDNCPCRGQSPITLMMSIWCSLCQSILS